MDGLFDALYYPFSKLSEPTTYEALWIEACISKSSLLAQGICSISGEILVGKVVESQMRNNNVYEIKERVDKKGSEEWYSKWALKYE